MDRSAKACLARFRGGGPDWYVETDKDDGRNDRGARGVNRVLWVVLLASLVFSGCGSIGPAQVPRDRFDYAAAISDSWKRQTLLNIVKIRYADMPVFVDVASVVSGYTVTVSVDIGGLQVPWQGGELFNLGASGSYTDRPTITYAPITGKEFTKSFLTPIPPSVVLFLMQSGWPVVLDRRPRPQVQAHLSLRDDPLLTDGDWPAVPAAGYHSCRLRDESVVLHLNGCQVRFVTVTAHTWKEA